MNKLKVGFFGGCFNPPTNVHTNLANNLIKDGILDKVIFVPVGDYYEKKGLISAKDRYNMLTLACKNYNKMEVENIACNHKDKLFAVETLKLIYDKYNTKYDIYFIMGSDNFEKMPQWKNYDELIAKYKFIVIERLNHNKVNTADNIIVYKNNTLKQDNNISSTHIRNLISNGMDITKYINTDVLEYIKEHKLYQDIF